MKVLLIPDKFKDSLSAQQVIDALKKGISAFNPSIGFHEVIASDGGDGFLEAIAVNDHINTIEVASVDPLGRYLKSCYGFDAKNHIAYIELANTSGLSLLAARERNVLETSTYGVGLQIKHAIEKGATQLYIGLGGSATNDGGIGMAAALGYQFLDREKNILAPLGKNLSLITEIVVPEFQLYERADFYAVNDVQNPLFGESGAAKVYARQKGADDPTITRLDQGLRTLHENVKKCLGLDKAFDAGSGAAGGAAYGLNVFLNAQFIDGAEFMLKKSGIYEFLEKDAIELIITGEGMIDDQTSFGKLVHGVSRVGHTFNVPVVAICGKNSLMNSTKEELGLTAIIEIADASKALAYNMKHASELIEQSIRSYFKENFNY